MEYKFIDNKFYFTTSSSSQQWHYLNFKIYNPLKPNDLIKTIFEMDFKYASNRWVSVRVMLYDGSIENLYTNSSNGSPLFNEIFQI